MFRIPDMIRKFKKDQRGQAIVEFAIALPVLLTVVCGILDFGWIYTTKLQVQHAAFEGARYASLNSDSATLSADVTEHVLSVSDIGNGSATITTSLSGDSVTVTVTYTIPTLTYVASTLFGESYATTATNVVAI